MTSNQTVDGRFGANNGQTDPNGLNTSIVFDGLGRKILERMADGNGTYTTYQYCSGVAGGTLSCRR
jgi:hypothetical protein